MEPILPKRHLSVTTRILTRAGNLLAVTVKEVAPVCERQQAYQTKALTKAVGAFGAKAGEEHHGSDNPRR
jgi:hypothetical protein